MFDIVAADEDDLSFSIDREGFDYCYPRWCVAVAQCASSPQRMPVRETMAMSANVPTSLVFPDPKATTGGKRSRIVFRKFNECVPDPRVGGC